MPAGGRKGGWFAVARKLYDGTDPIFGGETFSKRDAWIDLIQMAAWKDHVATVRGREVPLERGQLVTSKRYLRDRWGWSYGKVHRFLETLEEHDRMVPERSVTHVGTIFTIVNYDEYQPDPGTISGSRSGSASGSPERITSEPRSVQGGGPKSDPEVDHPNGSASGSASGSQEKKEVKKKGSKELQEDVEEEPELELTPEAPEQSPASWMHEVWRDELGIDAGPRVKLNDERRQKYEALYEEQLADLEKPRVAFRMILRCVQSSEHHMSKRSYQFPESLFRNETRRERWVHDTYQWAQEGGHMSDADRRLARRRREMDDWDLN